MAFDTAGNLVNDAAVEVGLSAVVDPFASTDANFVQLCRLLKSAGRELALERSWTHLRGEHLLTTVSGQSTYALPQDFQNMLEQSGWNRTNRLPIGGPLSGQEWQFLKARLVGVVFTVLFRKMSGSLVLYPDTQTPANYALAYEYQSSFWVTPAGTHATGSAWAPSTTYAPGTYVTSLGNIYTCTTGGTSGTTSLSSTGMGQADGTCVWDYVSVAGADAPASSSDTILFLPLLVVKALKAKWLLAKGFDATAAVAEYEDVLSKAADTDSPAPVLRLESEGLADPLLGGQSVPFTGFGT